MCQHHRSRIGTQRRFHDPSNGYTGGIHAALTDFFAAQDLTLSIQAEQKHSFIPSAVEKRHQIFSALFHGTQNPDIHRPLHLVIPPQRGGQTQQNRGIAANAGYFLQFFHRCLQHLGKTAEMFQKVMGYGVGILSWNRVKEQQFQHLHVAEMIQPFLEKALFQPLAVSVMLRHIFHLFALIALAIFPLIR